MATTKTYPAGRYYIGDLCYVNALGQKCWDEVCDVIFPPELNGVGVPGSHTVQGIDFWYHGTAYGDGRYASNIGKDFPVDAGIIGLVSAEVAERDGFDGGHIITFDAPFTPEYDDGEFIIGHLIINTDSDEYEDEDDDYNPDDEDENAEE